MPLSREQVLHIAELARLAISEEETARFAEQLSEILDYMDKLKGVDTTDIPPTAHPLARQNVTRQDIVCPSLSHQEALANAPQQRDGFFQVRRILE
jgi:aspartyl-tRNA(Asn)/glutamyl-tRNA(Gln) amidotransferase subunit C